FEPVMGAASSVFFNVGSMREDKQDAKQCWQVMRVNREDMEEKYGKTFTPFTGGKISSLYDLDCGSVGGSKDTYVAHYYEVVEKTIVEFNLDDGTQIRREGRRYFGQDGSRIDKEDFGLLLELYDYTEKRRTVKGVEYALVTGDGYLENPRLTPFKSIPVVPMYGYHIVINGIEYYCGEVCRQKDNQRFLNQGFGALMEIVSEPQTTKPEYAPEQIQRHAQARAEQTVKNFPFLMADPIRDQNGNPIHFGPTALHQPPQIGSGLACAIQFLNQNIAEQSGNGQATLPSNTSAAAVQQINERTDDAFLPLFTNATATIRCLCKVWIPAAQKLYFTNQRNIRIQLEDGSYKSEVTLQEEYRPDVGYGPYKNAARGRYDVSVKQGESYRTKKEADRTAALELLQYTPAETPLGQMIVMSAIQATTGEGMSDARTMARFMQIQSIVQSSMPLLMAGFPPEKVGLVDEEEQMIAQVMIQQMVQASQQPNPQAQLAAAESQARIMEGQADLIDKEVDRFNAETKRFEAMTKAQKAGFDAGKIAAETEGQQLKNASEFGNLVSGNFTGR
ncbi:MAG: portal protein, partial [Thalassolituus sp.]